VRSYFITRPAIEAARAEILGTLKRDRLIGEDSHPGLFNYDEEVDHHQIALAELISHNAVVAINEDGMFGGPPNYVTRTYADKLMYVGLIRWRTTNELTGEKWDRVWTEMVYPLSQHFGSNPFIYRDGERKAAMLKRIQTLRFYSFFVDYLDYCPHCDRLSSDSPGRLCVEHQMERAL
jgi:hypothetical protein